MRLRTVLLFMLLLPLFGCHQKASLPLGDRQLVMKVPGDWKPEVKKDRSGSSIAFSNGWLKVESEWNRNGLEEGATKRGFLSEGETRILGGYEGVFFEGQDGCLFVNDSGSELLYFTAPDADHLEELLTDSELVNEPAKSSKRGSPLSSHVLLPMIVFGLPAGVLAWLGVNFGWNSFGDDPHKLAARSAFSFVLFGLPILLGALAALGLGSLLSGSGGGGIMTPGVAWFIMVLFSGFISFIAAIPLSLAGAITVSSSAGVSQGAAAVRAFLACLVTSAFLSLWFQLM